MKAYICISNKYHLALKMPGVYSIPFECEKVYIRQTGHSVETRVKEHQRRIHLAYPEKSAITEHSINLGHRIQLHNTSILVKKSRYVDHIVREVTEMSSIQTTLIERMAAPSAGLGSL
jgi:hypothetical protein